MSFLTLSPGHKVKIGLTFETPDDEYIAMGAGEEAKVAIAEGLMTHEITEELIDQEMGLGSIPIAQLTIQTKSPITENKTVFMTKDELRRHIYECQAALKTMDPFGKLVDDQMAKYREGVRKKAEVSE